MQNIINVDKKFARNYHQFIYNIFKDFDMNYHKFGINLTLISAYKARTLAGPTLIIHENLNKIVPVMPK